MREALLRPPAIFTMIAATFLILLGIYFLCGLLFAVPFVLGGVKKIDSHADAGSWGFRLLIIPGVTAFWPLLLRRWMKGIKIPPEERNAHRTAARSVVPHASRLTPHAR